ncbi:hypothetical protein RB195_001349 [Necator americanus]|uniref:Uncharacterized protein n=1 Tax=Necator americanus TaxID=51031 RepID=A0ABR1DDW6_NECAM
MVEPANGIGTMASFPRTAAMSGAKGGPILIATATAAAHASTCATAMGSRPFWVDYSYHNRQDYIMLECVLALLQAPDVESTLFACFAPDPLRSLAADLTATPDVALALESIYASPFWTSR